MVQLGQGCRVGYRVTRVRVAGWERAGVSSRQPGGPSEKAGDCISCPLYPSSREI